MNALTEWVKHAPKPRKLADGKRWHVFLSYRSVNRPWVLNLYDVLRQHRHKVFLDQYVLKAGDPLVKTLENALDCSQAGVLIWSSASTDSGWVRREYETMEAMTDEDENFQFVPVRLDNTKLPRFAKRRLFCDFSAYPDGPNGGELLKVMYAIVGKPLSEEAVRFASEQDEEAKKAAAQIQAAIFLGAEARLIALFDKGGLPWETSASMGCQAAEGLTKLKHYDEAIEMLDTLVYRFPQAIRPKQLRALALAKRGEQGDLESAQQILAELYAAGEGDPETLGIYGRTWMDRYVVTQNRLHLTKSRDLYAEGFEGTRDDYYTGINAAAKSVFLGTNEELAKAADYARRVQEIVGTEPVQGDYWKTATVGEVFLIQKKYEDAGRLYAAAVKTAPEEKGAHESTWMQACRLMKKLAPTDEERQHVRHAFEHLPDRDHL